jgi:hypothetical protein
MSSFAVVVLSEPLNPLSATTMVGPVPISYPSLFFR